MRFFNKLKAYPKLKRQDATPSKGSLAGQISIVVPQAGNLGNVLAICPDTAASTSPPARRQAISIVSREEETTEERLNRETDDLFPSGFSADILAMCIEHDGNYSLKELKKMCVEAGLSPSGHKKLLAAKLIAHSFPLDKGKGIY